MAQQGGTWNPKGTDSSQNNTEEKEHNSGSSKQNKVDDDSRITGTQAQGKDEDDWNIIKHPEDETEPRHNGSLESKFNLSLGWGSWKTDVLKWDLKLQNAAPAQYVEADDVLRQKDDTESTAKVAESQQQSTGTSACKSSR